MSGFATLTPVGGGTSGGSPELTSPQIGDPRPFGSAMSSPLRAINAGYYYIPDQNGVYTDKPRVAMRVRQHMAAGDWYGLRVRVPNVRRRLSGGAINETKEGLEAFNHACAIEFANGDPGSKHYDSPNAGATVLLFGWGGGGTYGTTNPGNWGDSDYIWADDYEVGTNFVVLNDAGEKVFRFDREHQPCLCPAYWSLDDTKPLACPANTRGMTYWYPVNDRWRNDLASALACLAAIRTPATLGILQANPGSVPAAPQLIGCPAMGQKSVFVIGTSIDEYTGDNPYMGGEVNYINNEPANPGRLFLAPGWPGDMHCADLDGSGTSASVPVFEAAQGSAGLVFQWGDGASQNSDKRTTVIQGLAYCDVLVIGHGPNDGGATQLQFYTAGRRLLRAARAINPALKIVWSKIPGSALGVANYQPTTEAAQTPGTDRVGVHAAIDQFLAEGKIDRIVDLRDPLAVGTAGNPRKWKCEEVTRSFVAAAGSSATVINLAAPGIVGKIPNLPYFPSTFLRIGGEKRVVQSESNDGLSITVASAFSSAPAAGATVEAICTMSSDGLHCPAPGYRAIAAFYLRTDGKGIGDFLTIIPRSVS